MFSSRKNSKNFKAKEKETKLIVEETATNNFKKMVEYY